MRQRSRLAVVGVVVAVMLTTAVSGFARRAAPLVYPTPFYALVAHLTAAQEVLPPKGAGHATGLFRGRLVVKGGKATLTWQLRFSGLSGPASAAHIHYGAAGKPGNVAIPLCPPGSCRSGMRGTYSWNTALRPKLLRALLHGRAYVNVHTKMNPNGEIRGQVQAAAPVTASN